MQHDLAAVSRDSRKANLPVEDDVNGGDHIALAENGFSLRKGALASDPSQWGRNDDVGRRAVARHGSGRID
jgi:hypothetical protein